MNSDCIINHWLVDSASGSLIHQASGEQRRLGEYQLKLLQVLIDHAGEILTRDELNNLVWERRVIGNNSLPNAIHALRVALEDDGKQQRIIKTIPKKGYILEAEYCQFVESVPSEANVDPLNEETDNPLSLPCETLTPDNTNELAVRIPTEVSTNRDAFWRWVVMGQLIMLAIIALVIFGQSGSHGHTWLVEKNSADYSHIRMVEINRCTDNCLPSDSLRKQLAPVLFPVNQQLKNKQINMDMFYSVSANSLNLTFELKNACDSRQLAMNIINWRTDSEQLRAVIYRESERKIDEMAKCIN